MSTDEDNATLTRRAIAWLAPRLARGMEERFVEPNVQITPALAEQLLTLNTRNQNIKPQVVEKYARAMQEGRWRLTPEAISIGRDRVMTNGQHRCRSGYVSGVAFPCDIWFGIEPEEFRLIDTGVVRPAAALLQATRADNANERAALAHAVLRLQRRTNASYDPGLVADFAERLAEEDGERFTVAIRCGIAISKVANRTAASLAYYWISKYSAHPERLPDWWCLLRDGNIPDARDPQLRLRDLLRGRVDPVIWPKTAGRVLAVKQAAALINTWNAGQLRRRRCDFAWPSIIELPEVV